MVIFFLVMVVFPGSNILNLMVKNPVVAQIFPTKPIHSQVLDPGCAPSVALRGLFQRLPGAAGAFGRRQQRGSGGLRLPGDEGGRSWWGMAGFFS